MTKHTNWIDYAVEYWNRPGCDHYRAVLLTLGKYDSRVLVDNAIETINGVPSVYFFGPDAAIRTVGAKLESCGFGVTIAAMRNGCASMTVTPHVAPQTVVS